MWHGVPSAEQLETSGTDGIVLVASPVTVTGVEVDSTSISSVFVDELVENAVDVACGELVETAGVDTPVVVANAVSTSCERINCPAFLSPCTATGKTFPIMLEVDVLSEEDVDVSVGVDVATVVDGMSALRMSTMFGGGRFSIVVDEVPGVVVADAGGVGSGAGGGVTGVDVGVLVGADGSVSGSEGGTMTGSGNVGVDVGVCAGGDVTGVLVGVDVGTAGAACVGDGGEGGNCTSWMGVSFSAEVEAASSMYAELFFVKLPNGACGGRSCVSAFSGTFHPVPPTASGNICACFIS